MYVDLTTANDAARLEQQRVDRRAEQAWRFRNHRTKSVRVVETVLSSVLGFLIR